MAAGRARSGRGWLCGVRLCGDPRYLEQLARRGQRVSRLLHPRTAPAKATYTTAYDSTATAGDYPVSTVKVTLDHRRHLRGRVTRSRSRLQGSEPCYGARDGEYTS